MVDLLEISDSWAVNAGNLAGPGSSGRTRSPSGSGVIDGGTRTRWVVRCTSLTGVAAGTAAVAPRVTAPIELAGELATSMTPSGRLVGCSGELSGRALLAIEPTNMAAPATATPNTTGRRTWTCRRCARRPPGRSVTGTGRGCSGAGGTAGFRTAIGPGGIAGPPNATGTRVLGGSSNAIGTRVRGGFPNAIGDGANASGPPAPGSAASRRGCAAAAGTLRCSGGGGTGGVLQPTGSGSGGSTARRVRGSAPGRPSRRSNCSTDNGAAADGAAASGAAASDVGVAADRESRGGDTRWSAASLLASSATVSVRRWGALGAAGGAVTARTRFPQSAELAQGVSTVPDGVYV